MGFSPESIPLSTGICVSRKDAPRMGIKIIVHEGEPIRMALLRLKKLMNQQKMPSRRLKKKGPYCWMFITKEHYQKQSLLGRM
jgi:hypothetical protein